MLNGVESITCSRATTLVYTHEYPITLAKVGISQMSRLNARCLPILIVIFYLTELLYRYCKQSHVTIP